MVSLEVNWRKKLKPLADAAFTTNKVRLDFFYPYLFYFLWSRLVLDSCWFVLIRVGLVLISVKLVLIRVDSCWLVLKLVY